MATTSTTPTTWKTLHNTFPRVIFPQETHTDFHPDRHYALDNSNTRTNNTTFNLGVYNLHKVDGTTALVPIDPLCLTTLLSLLEKEGLHFPTSTDAINEQPPLTTQLPPPSISVLSYHAALDDQLPILIEDTKNTASKQIQRKIHHTKIINTFNSSHLNSDDLLTFELINHTIFDFYTLYLLQLPDASLLKYYSTHNYNFTESMHSLTPLTKYIAKSVRQHLLKRNDFHVRNPDTFNFFTSLIVPKYTSLSYKSESARITREAVTLISYLNEVLSLQQFWDGEKLSIIDLQIASYFYCFQHFRSLPAFNSILAENDALNQHADRVISSFVA